MSLVITSFPPLGLNDMRSDCLSDEQKNSKVFRTHIIIVQLVALKMYNITIRRGGREGHLSLINSVFQTYLVILET